jgi:hypothetical membrane protein
MKIAMSATPLFDGRPGPRGWLLPALVLLAALCFGGSVWGFGAGLDGYSQLAHAVSILGAHGIPHAAAFNVVGFLLPGLLMVIVAAGLCRSVASAEVLARIGGWIVLFSTLAFAALGAFPLHADDSEAASSRLHIACWSLWWLTAATGGVLLSLGSRRWHRGPGWRIAGAVVAMLVPWCSVQAPAAWGFALSERIAFGLWFGWWLLATVQLRRGADQP